MLPELGLDLFEEVQISVRGDCRVDDASLNAGRFKVDYLSLRVLLVVTSCRGLGHANLAGDQDRLYRSFVELRASLSLRLRLGILEHYLISSKHILGCLLFVVDTDDGLLRINVLGAVRSFETG